MKKILCLLLAAAFAALFSSCWKEEIPAAGAPRHQVENLKAVPGDGTVTLSWSLPDGWEATDFLIFYADEQLQTVKHYTGGAMQYTVGELANGHAYTFNVQAVYGGLVSQAVTVDAKPAAK